MCVLVVGACGMTSRKQNRLATSGVNRRIGLNKNVKAQPSTLHVVLFWSCVLAGFAWLLLMTYF